MTADAPPRIALRDMTRADLKQVRRIERAAYRDAWPRTTFEHELGNALAHYLVAVEAPPAREPPPHPPHPLPGPFAPLRRWLARRRRRERVAGFAGVWFTVDQLHVITLAVAPDRQGRGIGQRLLLECFALARGAGMRNIALEVRPSNERAIRLYERFGFRRSGSIANYYAADGEDALVMLTPDLDDPDSLQREERLRVEHRARYGAAFDATTAIPGATTG